jgi:ribonuclease HII
VAQILPSYELELSLHAEGYRVIAGVDEVGRGSWAGPVVAGAVVLPHGSRNCLTALRDSKQLSAQERESLFGLLRAIGAAIGIGWASHHVVDRVGLTEANRRAMLRAIRGLREPPDVLLLDHFRLPACPIPQLALPQGDARVLSVAAASVVAKVVRDRWMECCDERFPGYGFARHKGYGTPDHQCALASLGPSHIHRQSFAPVADLRR